MLSRLLSHREGRAAPPGLRVLLLGGAAAAPELLTRALAAGYPVCPTYGLTESCSQVATAAPPPVGAACALPMLPLRGTELRIDIDGRDAPPGTPGEIVVRGPTVMQGYLHDPQSTAWVLRAGWLYTGDIGCLDSEGGLRVLDRRDDLIVSGGENVYPAEIEAVLLEHPSVDDAGVAGVPDADLGARVVAWVVAAPGKAPDVEALQRHCRAGWRASSSRARFAMSTRCRAMRRVSCSADGWRICHRRRSTAAGPRVPARQSGDQLPARRPSVQRSSPARS